MTRRTVAWIAALALFVALALWFLAVPRAAAPDDTRATPPDGAIALADIDSGAVNTRTAAARADTSDHVRIVDATTRNGIAGAFAGLDGDAASRRAADERGDWFASADALRDHTLNVRADGYWPRDVAWTEIAVADPREIALTRTGTLTVRVMTDDGRPVHRAYVELSPLDPGTGLVAGETPAYWPICGGSVVTRGPREPDREVDAFTDANGAVRFSALPCGVPFVATAERGLPPTSVRASIDERTRALELEVRAPPLTVLRGRLVHANGAPVDGVRILAQLTREGGYGAETAGASGRDGRFTTRGFAAGSLVWRVAVDGQPFRTTELAGPSVDVGDIVLPSTCELRGRIVSALPDADQGLGLCELRCTRAGTVVARTSPASRAIFGVRAGEFRFEVLPGQCTIEVLVGDRVLTRRDVEAPCPPFDIELDGVTAELELVDLPFPPPTAARILIAPVVANRANTARGGNFSTSEDFKLLTWRERSLVLALQAPGVYEGWLTDAGERDAAIALGRFELAAGKRRVLSLAGRGGHGDLAGRVLDAHGQPVAGTRVFAGLDADPAGIAQRVASVDSDADGRFAWSARAAGDYRVWLGALGFDDASARTVRVDAGRVSNVELRCAGAGRLHVAVTRDGAPFANAVIRVRPLRDQAREQALLERSCDDRGDAVFDGLLAGTYTVSALPPSAYTSEGREAGYIVREFAVPAGGETRAAFELEAAATRVRFVRNGTEWREAGAARALWRGGRCKVARDSALGDARTALLDPGPWLFIVDVAEEVHATDPPLPQRSLVAFVPAPGHGVPAELDVVFDDGEITLERHGTEEVLPLAKFESLGDFARAASPWLECFVSFTDDGVRRTFHHLPRGAKFTLEPPRGSLVAPTTLSVPANGRATVAWP